MILSAVEWIAFLSSTISLVPQIWKSHTTRSTEDLSWLMLFNILLCSVAWIAYGVILHATAVWTTNIVMAVSCFYLIAFKYWNEYARG
ncbi:MAG: PQ-loop repeat-containing protein [Deltaproteobacteria bacterium]|nr:PQ-loop repeat-containing protein [Deltaproteobacteria bacterium]